MLTVLRHAQAGTQLRRLGVGSTLIGGLLAALLASPPCAAADLILDSSLPADLSLGRTPLVTTWGAYPLRVTGLEPGLLGLVVRHQDSNDTIDLLVPNSGAALLQLDELGLHAGPIYTQLEVPPVVEFRAAAGQRFAVVLDDVRVAVVGSRYPVRLDAITAGPHSLELRTADLTVVWTRAELDLQPDDLVIITAQEGYAPLVSARPGAVVLTGAAPPDAARPRPPQPSTPQSAPLDTAHISPTLQP